MAHSSGFIGDRTPSREDVARRDLGHTLISVATARLLVGAFLTLIVLVPIVEIVAAWRPSSVEGAWSHLVRPAAADTPTGEGAWTTLVAWNRGVLERLHAFERALEQDSVLGRALRPSAQALLTTRLGVGNERVYPGRDGWLFYRPDVEYLSGRPFLSRDTLARRVAAAREWNNPPQPDPRPALRRFHADLAARGIALLILPVPAKAGVHHEYLGDAHEHTATVLHNPSFRDWVNDLAQHGLSVFDPTPLLEDARRATPQYLRTDTHWRPEVMETIAGAVAHRVRTTVLRDDLQSDELRTQQARVENQGDIARMLDVTQDVAAARYPPETVWLRRVLQADGTPWRASRTADVLLIGDSFTNIYSLESMGWGTAAGLAEHLSLALGRPVDRIAQNDNGAFATREALARDPDRLSGKRVVIYQFAERELAFGDWRVLPIPR